MEVQSTLPADRKTRGSENWVAICIGHMWEVGGPLTVMTYNVNMVKFV